MNRIKCYNEQLVCPRQIDDKPCDCEWLPENKAKEEVIEKIASLIYNQHLEGRKSDEIAEAILNLYYDCKECGGSGLDGSFGLCVGVQEKRCPSCKGTGKGRPMIAIVPEE